MTTVSKSKIKYPKGYPVDGKLRIAIRLDEKLFKDIVAMARLEKRDFNSMVTALIECGKLCLDESDRLEVA